jgi:AraC family transcriptional regulator of arabinose operon
MPELIRNLSRIHRVRSSAQVTFGDVTYQPGGQCGPRVQQDFQLVAIYEGQAYIQIDDDMRHLPAQHIALMRPGHTEHFFFDRTGKTHHTWCAVHPALVDGPLADVLGRTPFCLPVTSRLHSLMEAGLSFAPGDRTSAQNVLTQLGLTLLHAFAYEAEYAALRSLTPDAIALAQHYIETHLTQPILLVDIARAANVTPQHLVRLFNQHLHTTPMRYVWDARTRRGADLLIQTGLTMSEIAEQCGFQSPFHFSRLIKLRYGLPPRQLRNRNWQLRQGHS